MRTEKRGRTVQKAVFVLRREPVKGDASARENGFDQWIDLGLGFEVRGFLRTRFPHLISPHAIGVTMIDGTA